MIKNILESFNLRNKVCIVTGGAGLLGERHVQAILEAGGTPVILDKNENVISKVTRRLKKGYKIAVLGIRADITSTKDLENAKKAILKKYNRIDVLINNAANNPKIENIKKNNNRTRFENFPREVWDEDLAVGLKGAFFASQVFGSYMAQHRSGVILNISSDLGIIAPDQRIYKKEGLKQSQRIVKPVTYSVVKHGLIGLTKYLATYWAEKGIRVNALCPGGVFNGQDKDFVEKLTNLIPLGRMADIEEYKATIVYMISGASSYMTGSVVIIDGGRTAW